MNIQKRKTGGIEMKKKLKIIAIFYFGLLLLLPFVAKTQSVEYFVKASLMSKIAQYTEWGTTQNENAFKIAVLGESPFKGELEKLAENTQIRNKKIEIHYLKKYKDSENFNVVFICESEKNRLDEILVFLKGKNVMIISDSPRFSGEGVHFNFYTEPDSTIHFEIDLDALEESGLRPDLKLLTIGKIIN